MILTSLIFLFGYSIIALEHKIKIDKAASALFMGILLWIILAFSNLELSDTLLKLKEHFEEIAEILFFLLGAMTIVELIDVHDGFGVLQKFIKTKNKMWLLWILSILTFFLSAVLDNLTTTIVMVSILKKFIHDKYDVWFFAGFIIIAANAGGAWSPIGDVTTIMLWNGGQVTSNTIMADVFLPSLVCLLAPLLIASYKYKNSGVLLNKSSNANNEYVNSFESNFILVLGIILLLLVPIFKSISRLPPFMGMLFSLSIFWVVTELFHRKKPQNIKHQLSVAATIQKIDTPSIIFFLGILMAVAAIETNGSLRLLGKTIENSFSNFHVINALLGMISSLIDNVPLVAGAMGMYSLERYPKDHEFWTFLAYCAGTGGSILIIGSAAGVAAMGILKIDFFWYLKRISWLSLFGYAAGILAYLILN